MARGAIAVGHRIELQLPLIAIGLIIVVALVTSFNVAGYKQCSGALPVTRYNNLLFWTALLVLGHMFLAAAGVKLTMNIKKFVDCLPSAAISALALSGLVVTLGFIVGREDVTLTDTGASGGGQCQNKTKAQLPYDWYVITFGLALAACSLWIFGYVRTFVARGGDASAFA